MEWLKRFLPALFGFLVLVAAIQFFAARFGLPPILLELLAVLHGFTCYLMPLLAVAFFWLSLLALTIAAFGFLRESREPGLDILTRCGSALAGVICGLYVVIVYMRTAGVHGDWLFWPSLEDARFALGALLLTGIAFVVGFLALPPKQN